MNDMKAIFYIQNKNENFLYNWGGGIYSSMYFLIASYGNSTVFTTEHFTALSVAIRMA